MRRNNGLGDTEVVLHRKPKIDTYEISASELDLLANTTMSEYCLEFGLCFLSGFISCACSLFVIDEGTNPRSHFWYSVATIITLVLGLFLLGIWLKTKDDKKKIVEKIKNQPEVPSVGY